MYIRFFYKATGVSVNYQGDYYIDTFGNVFRDNGRCFESQSQVVSLPDFLEECPEVDWEIVS